MWATNASLIGAIRIEPSPPPPSCVEEKMSTLPFFLESYTFQFLYTMGKRITPLRMAQFSTVVIVGKITFNPFAARDVKGRQNHCHAPRLFARAREYCGECIESRIQSLPWYVAILRCAQRAFTVYRVVNVLQVVSAQLPQSFCGNLVGTSSLAMTRPPGGPSE